MPVTPDQMRKWAMGAQHNAVTEDEANKGPGNPHDSHNSNDVDDEMKDEGENPGPENDVWAGRVEGDQVTPEQAEELMGWLEQNEPEVLDAVTELAKAAVEGDEAMMDHAKSELKTVAQNLSPEYPELGPAEKSVMPVAIESRLEQAGNPEPETPEHKEALAKGVAETRHAAGPTPGKEFRDLPEGWTDASRAKFWRSLGGSFDACTAKMKGEGLEDVDEFCGALKARVEG